MEQLLQHKIEYWPKMTFSCHFLDSVTLRIQFQKVTADSMPLKVTAYSMPFFFLTAVPYTTYLKRFNKY